LLKKPSRLLTVVPVSIWKNVSLSLFHVELPLIPPRLNTAAVLLAVKTDIFASALYCPAAKRVHVKVAPVLFLSSVTTGALVPVCVKRAA
jgi:hypothetical protein